MIQKDLIVFNEVRQPYNHTYKEVNYLYIITKTELLNLVSFSRVLYEPLTGKALEHIQSQSLISELSIY